MKKFWGFLLLVGGLLFAWFASTYIFWQQRALHDFIPVPAKILNATVEVHHGSKGSTSYSPEITYSYDFKGQPYTSTQVLTFSAESSQDWADDIVSRYGGPTYSTALEGTPLPRHRLYRPRQPQRFNPQQVSISAQPYTLTTILLFAAAFGRRPPTPMSSASANTMSALALDDSGWQLLLPTNNLRKSYRPCRRHVQPPWPWFSCRLYFTGSSSPTSRSFLTWLITGIIVIVLSLFL